MTNAAKPKTKKPPGHADPDQFERFRKVAEEVEASDDPAEFDKGFNRVASSSTPAGAKPR